VELIDACIVGGVLGAGLIILIRRRSQYPHWSGLL